MAYSLFNPKTLIAILLAIFLSAACSKDIEPIKPLPESLDYLALGDSYTIGQGVAESERWPNQLSRKLEENDLPIGTTKIIARTGWTTRNLINAIEDADLSDLGEEKLVSLLIGVNNQYRGMSVDIFQTEFELLLDTAIELAGGVERFFVVSIPDYGVTPFGAANQERIGQELDQYNAYMKERCIARNIPYINITDISRELGNASDALAADQLHPSGFQYGKWVEKILPVVREILAE